MGDTESKQTAHINGVYVIIAAIIGGVFLIGSIFAAAMLNKKDQLQTSVALEVVGIEGIKQPLNSKALVPGKSSSVATDTEISAFRIFLRNNGAKPIFVSSAVLRSPVQSLLFHRLITRGICL